MLRLKLSAERIYLGWGVFDAIYIARYIVFSLIAGRVPYLDDFRSGMELVAVHGVYAKVLVMLTWGIELSIILSCCLFLHRCRLAKWVAYFQVPFRLMFFLPSVSIVFMGPDLKERYGIGLLLLLLILSECLKVWTLWASRQALHASA
ncbi:hypothetical protein ACIQAL_16670 [Pseudomonas sp. NPDC088368]|jgi:hypothetical protein|uniref:hypothetical protein n=1 Tax=Pseudomonas sp. NPDC088368 TaxID=3364453 RepID=UPI00381880A3